MIKKIIFLTFLFTTVAKANIFIDPYFGIMMGGEMEVAGNESSFTGFDMGARFGWEQMGLFTGLDYRYTNFSVDNATEDKLTGNHWAAVVGYEFPFFLRLYGEYIFSSNLEDDSGRGYNDLTGTILGVGVKLLAFVAFNIEFVDYTTDGRDGSPLDTAHDYYLISASLPLSF
jgi:hypothetical protein